jgi:hypothetical protein
MIRPVIALITEIHIIYSEVYCTFSEAFLCDTLDSLREDEVIDPE